MRKYQKAFEAARACTYVKGSNQYTQSPGLSVREASKRFGVSARQVARVKAVLTHGTPEIIKLLERGRISITKAESDLKGATIPHVPSQPKVRRKAVVYFIDAIGGNRIKIGRTMRLSARLRNLQAMSPLELRVIHSLSGSHDLERALHIQFKEHRLHGEWFAAEPVRNYLTSLGVAL
jgi:hypothetical protein